MLDLTGSSTMLGKPALNDLKSGVVTAPVLFAAQQQPELCALIKRKFRSSGDVDRVRGGAAAAPPRDALCWVEGVWEVAWVEGVWEVAEGWEGRRTRGLAEGWEVRRTRGISIISQAPPNISLRWSGGSWVAWVR